MSDEEAIWMSETDFCAQFSYFNLGDKAVAKGAAMLRIQLEAQF